MEIETVADLIAALHQYDGDLPVAIAQQPDSPQAAVPVSVTEWAGRVWLATRETDVDGSPYAPADAWVV